MFSYLKKIFNQSDVRWTENDPNARTYYREASKVEAKKLMTAIDLVSKLLEENEDKQAASDKANDWIDSTSVQIRENNDSNDIIDYFCAPDPESFNMDWTADLPVYQTAIDYVNAQTPQNVALNGKLQQLQVRVAGQIRSLVAKNVNVLHGLSMTNQVLHAVLDQNQAFIMEMRDENNVYTTVKLAQADADLKQYCGLLADNNAGNYSSEGFKSKIVEAAQKMALCRREIKRREYAVIFFKWFGIEIRKNLYLVSQVEDLLSFTLNRFKCRLTELEEPNDAKTSVLVVPRNVDVSTFVQSLPDASIMHIQSMSPNQIYNSITAACDEGGIFDAYKEGSSAEQSEGNQSND